MGMFCEISPDYSPEHFLGRERENAGLNVTCASRVFLLESVVHHSFEIQGKSWKPSPFLRHLPNRALSHRSN